VTEKERNRIRKTWRHRKLVKKCDYQDFVDCPRCGLGISCGHELVTEFKCAPDDCPIFDLENNRWLTEEQAQRRYDGEG
jgi:hypothetical protein